jgi:hypothetical protein
MKSIIQVILCTCSLGHLNAQTLINKAAITVNNGATFYINGSFTNADNGTIEVKGEMTISGNLNNNSSTDCFLKSNGKVNLTGNSSQSISGTHSWNFPVLSLQSGFKYLNQLMTVGEVKNFTQPVLQLNNSYLFLNTKQLTIKTAQVNSISKTTGYIVNDPDANGAYGKIQWNIGSSTQGTAFEFPFGNINTGHYTPVQITLMKNSVGSNGKLIVATYPTPTSGWPNNRPLPSGVLHMNDSFGNDISHKCLDRFWTIQSEGFDSLPLLQVNMKYRDSEWDTSNNSSNMILEDSLTAQQYESDSWNKKTCSLNKLTNIFVVDNVMSPYQVWSLTEKKIKSPRELSSKPNTGISQEMNPKNILFNESNVMILESGRMNKDQIEKINVVVYPNPASEIIYLDLKSESEEELKVSLIDLSGRVIDNWNIPAGQRNSSRIVSGIASGTYFLSLGNCSQFSKNKIVIE